MVHKKYDTRKNYKMNFNFNHITIIILTIIIILQYQTTQELLRILAK